MTKNIGETYTKAQMKATRLEKPKVECPYCHDKFSTNQALSSHLAYKHSTTLEVEKAKLKSDGDVRKALAATQENVGRMAESLARLDAQSEKSIIAVYQLALAGWYRAVAVEACVNAISENLAGNDDQAAESLSNYKQARQKSEAEFKKFEALAKIVNKGGA